MKLYLKKIFILLLSIVGNLKLRSYLITHKTIKIIVGAGNTKQKGWCSTENYFFDITQKSDFEKFFVRKKIDFIIAEHVLEHIDEKNLESVVLNFYEYTSDVCNIRIAVPDGFHSDKKYLEYVKPGGTGPGAEDHKILFNYKSLTELFSKRGFVYELIEYWDEDGKFHSKYKNDKKGNVCRSFINDERNIDNKPSYTSLIIDFRKNF